jgi:hypothetical protein
LTFLGFSIYGQKVPVLCALSTLSDLCASATDPVSANLQLTAALCCEVLREFLGFFSYGTTAHAWALSSSLLRFPNNIQTQETNIHARSGIRTGDPSNEAAADLRLRPRGHWDRRDSGNICEKFCLLSFVNSLPQQNTCSSEETRASD